MHVHELDDDNFLNSSVLTFGNFDGLHRGHQHLLNILKSESDKSMLKSVVLTFSPHTNEIISKSTPFSILTPYNIKKNNK